MAKIGTQKIPSRSARGLTTFPARIYHMTKFLLLTCLVLAVSPGCMLMKKRTKPKDNSAISTEVAENFRKRWVEKRSADLVAQGTVAEAARMQAEGEFRERYDLAPLGTNR